MPTQIHGTISYQMSTNSVAKPPKSSVNSWSRLILFGGIVLILLTGFVWVMWAEAFWPDKVSNDFHKLLYNRHDQTWDQTKWLGVPIEKNPLDLMIFQEIIYEVKPDVIVEAGTADGGSALYMATILEMLQKGRIITIDIAASPKRPANPRIQYLIGSSTSTEIVDKVKSAISPTEKVMVVLDSDHRKEHVLKELLIYSKLVTKGSYLILEDTNNNGHPVRPDFGPGSMEALQEYQKDHSDLETDKSREKLFVTFNPNGYLRKVKDSVN
jgi:cephalosporin hydroxylase